MINYSSYKIYYPSGIMPNIVEPLNIAVGGRYTTKKKPMPFCLGGVTSLTVLPLLLLRM